MKVTINRQLLGVEDLLFGTGTVTQTRAGQEVEITEINAGNLPFDETQTLLEWAQTVNLEVLGASIEALNNLNDNLSAVLAVNDNESNINTLAPLATQLQALYDNILAIQNNYNNKDDISLVAANITDINDIATQIIPNLAEILQADDNATIATTKASEASASAVVASAYANINWAGFSVVDGELIVTYANGLTSIPSIVDGDFIITY